MGSEETLQEAWVALPPRPNAAPGDAQSRNPYSIYRPAMGRLVMAHDTIGQQFVQLFIQIMFAPGHLSRKEREMVASVAAAAQDCYY